MFFIHCGDFSRMTPSGVLFCLCLLWNQVQMNDLKTSAPQGTGFVLADIGGNTTLRCSFDNNAVYYYWFKQSLGQKPQFISKSYKQEDRGTFSTDFKNNLQLSLQTEIGMSQLKISDLQLSDTGTYFCASSLSLLLSFEKSFTVFVRDSVLEKKASIHQTDSQTAQPGGDVALKCEVRMESWDGEYRVYWFKNSGESDPGLFYTDDNQEYQCVRNLNRETHTCVYNLTMKNIRRSQVGTYYCAVASKGQILFGNGTRLKLESKVVSLVLVPFLGAALIITSIVSALLAFVLYKNNKRDSCQSSGFQVSQFPNCLTTNREGDSLHYAAVNVNQPTRSRRQKQSLDTECVYSSMKQ